MCGIAGFHNLDPNARIDRAGTLADNLLYAIVDRGRDATGMLTIDHDGKPRLQRKAVGAFSFVRTRKLVSPPRTALLHTRFATTGRRTSVHDSHPQVAGKAAAIHNGTIVNADELFEAFGIERKNKVDTEIIPALISHAGWSQAEQALSLMRGGAATAVVHQDHPGEVLLARVRSYPLCVAHVKRLKLVVWASTEHAIRQAWLETYGTEIPAKIEYLAPGQGYRLNGKVEPTTIPGVYGVEKDRVWTPTRSTSKTAKAGTPGKAKPAAGKKGKRSTRFDKAKSKALTMEANALMAKHARSGGAATTGEIRRLLDELAALRSQVDELEAENRHLAAELSLYDALDDWDVDDVHDGLIVPGMEVGL